MICITPSWSLSFWQKGGRKICLIYFTLNPLLMIDKKGEKYLSLYASLLFVSYWYQEFLLNFYYWYQKLLLIIFQLVSRIFIDWIFFIWLVSRAFMLLKFSHWNFYWYQEQLFKEYVYFKKEKEFIFKKKVWYQEHVYFMFGIKSMFISLFYAYWCIFIHCIYLLFIAMHELRGSFFEA